MIVYLDVDCEEGLQRRKTGGDEWNRMDEQTIEFHRRVREGYLAMAQEQPERWRIVNGARPVEAVAEEIKRLAAEKLQANLEPET